ncbi:MAG: hypothetical protein ACOX6I_01945 [Syntrophomonadaceae bacterium]
MKDCCCGSSFVGFGMLRIINRPIGDNIDFLAEKSVIFKTG